MRQRAEKKKEKKGEEDIQGEPIHWLHATGSSTPVASLCVEEGGRPRVETTGGTGVGDARDVGAAGHRRRRQVLVTAWLLRYLAKREWGRARMVFGCVLRECANAQDWEKKNEKNKNEKRERKKKRKTDSL